MATFFVCSYRMLLGQREKPKPRQESKHSFGSGCHKFKWGQKGGQHSIPIESLEWMNEKYHRAESWNQNQKRGKYLSGPGPLTGVCPRNLWPFSLTRFWLNGKSVSWPRTRFPVADPDPDSDPDFARTHLTLGYGWGLYIV